MGLADPDSLREPLRMMLDELRPPAIVAALGRQGSPLFTDTDRACHQMLFELCREAGIDLLAAYVATEHAVRELPEHLRLAS